MVHNLTTLCDRASMGLGTRPAHPRCTVSGAGTRYAAGRTFNPMRRQMATRLTVRPRASPLQRNAGANGSLSQKEVDELMAENAKLKQVLTRYMDRLTPEQLETLRDQYQGLQDLAASAGIQLQPLPFAEAHNTADNAAADTASSKAAIQDDSNTPNSNKQGNSTLSSTAVRSSSKLRAVAEQVIEYDEGDDKVKVHVLDSGDEVQFKFEATSPPPVQKPKSSSRSSSNSSNRRSTTANAAHNSTPAGLSPSTVRVHSKRNVHTAASRNTQEQDTVQPADKLHADAARGNGIQRTNKNEANNLSTEPANTASTTSADAANINDGQQVSTTKTAASMPVGSTASAAGAGHNISKATSTTEASRTSRDSSVARLDVQPALDDDSSRRIEARSQGDADEGVDDDDDTVAAKITPQQQAERERKTFALRADSDSLANSHNPADIAADRHHWLIFTVPETPVAGADCVVYFNKAQSETLRGAPRLQVQLGFNHWQLSAEHSKMDLEGSTIPHMDGSDFWQVKFKVPEDTYEINMVFSDGVNAYDNNLGQDYTYPVEGGVSWEEWVDAAADRAAKAEAERLEAEQVAAQQEQKRLEQEKLTRDEEVAKKRIQDMKDQYAMMAEGAVDMRKLDNGAVLWACEPQPPSPGQTATVFYNSKAGPLSYLNDHTADAPVLNYGFNNWKVAGDKITMSQSSGPRLNTTGDEAGQELWWQADISVPSDAVSVCFCVNVGDLWDNNNQKDHKILVSLPHGYTDHNAWADSLYDTLVNEVRQARLAAEQEELIREQRRAEKRKQAQELCKVVLRRQLKHIMFTEPEVVQAGQTVTVYYSPQVTALNGREQIYITAGFNRWTHVKQAAPTAMTPPGAEGVYWRATLNVPKDAYLMDLVFSDVAGGEGTYDNNNGMDYHLPVEGGVGARPVPLHVMHIAVEMAPIAKVGGLGDVVTALGRAVKEEGHKVEVILPRYSFFNSSPLLGGMRHEAEFDWGGTKICVTSCVVEGLKVFFIEPKNGFFNTGSVYGRYDDEVRFDFFCKAALEFCLQTQRQPDILHCHDWSTAHVAKAFWEDYKPYGLSKPKVVFTIHNMHYGEKKIAEAANYCQKFTTVSPTYAYEVGCQPSIAGHSHKFLGIRNGIDQELWGPENDQFLPTTYTSETVEEGKRRAREALRQRLNLTGWNDKVMVGVVSRLTPQKGVQLIKHAAYKTLDRGGQFVLLGSAPDPKVQAEFNTLANSLGHSQDAAFAFYYDEPLSHLIYAACDMLLVPSMFEPCGLTQLIAMGYGAVPVVRHTGGLRDTVFDVDNDKARAAWEVYGSTDWESDGVDATNGFAFEGADTGGLDYALNRAIDAWYNDKEWFRGLQKRVMEQDWSWNRPAIDYVELYYSAMKA